MTCGTYLVNRYPEFADSDAMLRFTSLMSKETRLTFRVRSDLKKSLETIAAREARSVAQVCEVILQSAVKAYEKEGSKYFYRLISHRQNGGNKD
jgi:hypothetical protein